MDWKGREEFVSTGDRIVAGGLIMLVASLVLSLGATGSDIFTWNLTISLQILGLGAILMGSAIFIIGKLRTD